MAANAGETEGLSTSTGVDIAPPIGGGKHILFIAAHFAPESTSGTHRSLHFARSMHDEGFQVTVLTVDRESLGSVDPLLDSVFPYQDRIIRVSRNPTLETMYLSWKRRWISVGRRFQPEQNGGQGGSPAASESQNPRNSRSSLRHEVSGLVSYPDQFRGWYRPAINAAIRLSLTSPVHAVFASGPPWTSLRVAHRLSRRTGCKLIVDFRDPWTRRMGFIDPSDPRLVTALSERDEARIIADSAAVLVNSPYLLSNALRYDSGNRAPFHCVLNGTDVPAATEEHGFPAGAPLTLRHFGSLYGGRSIEPLVVALTTSSDVDLSRVRIELFGHTEANTTLGLRLGTEAGIAVECKPTVPHSEAARIMATPAVLLTVQSRDFSAQIPTKLYEYLRTGNPVLVLAEEKSAVWQVASGFPRARRLDYEDAEVNRKVISELYAMWKGGSLRQTRTDVDTRSFGKSVVGRQFADLVNGVLSEGARADASRGRAGSHPWRSPQPITRR